ncbi:hypothetical protein H112_00288 [Trichophyton rubrum D6]|uniref:Kynurenine formamidase n=5 Tax=Trichophyton TaxID=5550 RepID=A0A178EWC4_TRIRU|nr:uncharacterized protein TERG_08428 [Trichophyton rubrum CBS 118892]EZF27808.1 hypothetical protein H100_00289 [Trichophyton rubrum MR850]EZF46782.1 hypothetical protein H102_00288 [Trichophyton rubrum CBS 100081]EZF57441.1 hypothetical protein H103_00287 [Trichophyton rubrum CBS 288.86]EZF68047.1 hypothetical protein H104_00287 [Trichophyton rubrum CBS 289.86]EZF78709.1 hypothetical protein H105_00282 [Trichophyton soudanense CBS 452.61]EZF89398.1 hypothetical protein H110_00291 [Trichophy
MAENGYEKYSYGEHYLQNVYVHIPPSPAPANTGYWIVYIHGGAWRDPDILAPSFKAAQDHLLSDHSVSSSIAGIASIDYRLSAHPNHPQDPTSLDASEYRNAKHPEHIHDVRDGLALLQSMYGFGERYVLAGHSCGGTMAFQVVMNRVLSGYEVVRPVAVVSVAGVTNLLGLVEEKAHISAYREFVTGAFGDEAERTWEVVSPAVDGEGVGGVVDSWNNGRVVVMGFSVNDEALPGSQLGFMKGTVDAWVAAGDGGAERRVRIVEDMAETHDGMWINGREVAEVIAIGIRELEDMQV